MAFIVLKNNSKMFVESKRATKLWEIMTGRSTGNKKDTSLSKQIDKIYLNRNTAPQSYLDESHILKVDAMPELRLPYKE